LKTRWPIVAVLLVTSAAYFHALATAPVSIGGDEARFATAASSIASSGRDLAGNRLPLFFHLPDSLAAEGGTRWYQPLLFYLMALTFRFLPFDEQSMRLPAAVIGVLDVLLLYVVARRLLGDRRWAALAALLLALSPAHFIFSRQALDYICPLPFVLGWLWCVIAAVDTGDTRLSLASGLILGVGFYSYIASWAMMPLLLLLTYAAHYRSGARPARHVLASTIGFSLPVLAAIAWLGFHPEMWRDIAGRYRIYDARHLSPPGLPRPFTFDTLHERVSVYWDYFNPAYLFFSGGSNLSMATRRVGVFLLPISVFLACGLYECWRRRSGVVGGLLVAGLAIAPLPATLVDERYAIQRELVVLPFVVLIATLGATFVLRHHRRGIRLAGVLLLLAMPAQFAYFWQDYFGDYRIRSAFAFDPANFRGVADYLITSSPSGQAPLIYLSEDLDDVAARWRFYLVKHRREDLLERTSLFPAKGLDVGRVPPGSLLVFYANDPAVPAWLGPDKCAVAASIADMSGANAAVILRKSSSLQATGPRSRGSP
jgi:4-amino-4-deoxy-L-arabinose transferase-like glycosyltransferase